MNDKVAQVIGRIPNLTQEQIDQLGKVNLFAMKDIEDAAEAKQGFASASALSVVSKSVSFEVFAVARLAILGILAGSDELVTPWTSVVGDFVEEAPEEAVSSSVDAPHAPTEEEATDLGRAEGENTAEIVSVVETDGSVTESPVIEGGADANVSEGDIEVPLVE